MTLLSTHLHKHHVFPNRCPLSEHPSVSTRWRRVVTVVSPKYFANG